MGSVVARMKLPDTNIVGRMLDDLFSQGKASVIIPCFNEEATLGKVIDEAKKSALVDEIIVVDDGSTDSSSETAIRHLAKLVRHRKNEGKGKAILTGAGAAKNDVLVFVDADLENFTSDVIDRLASQVLAGETKFCKSTFEREGGRVTELVAKPLLEFIYPEAKLNQPLSGQFCITKELLLSLEVSPRWGIDISILLSALKKGEKIIEVNIGEVRHKHRDLIGLASTARDVTRTILQNAGFLAKKHKLLLFDFDGTLVKGSSITHIFQKMGLEKTLADLREEHRKGKITERQLTMKIARSLSGRSASDFERAASGVQPFPYAHETIEYLRRMGYKLVVISFGFRRVVDGVFPRGSFDLVICPKLAEKNGRFTGKVSIPRFASPQFVFSKGKAAKSILKKLKAKPDETIAVGNAKSDEEMLREVRVPVVVSPPGLLPRGFIRLRSLPELIVIAN